MSTEVAIYSASVPDRIRSKVALRGECWEWTASTDPRGYGRVWDGARSALAHRVIFQLVHRITVGPDVVICHHCDNPSCVRPSHLFAGTQQDNLNDMKAKGRQPYHSVCRNGHPRTDDNHYQHERRGYRVCRECARVVSRRKYLKRKARLEAAA